jgi:transcriptional regulator with XRE-family HTH domain
LSSPAPRATRLSATLKQLRKRAGLSEAQAALRAGLSQSTVSRFEAGSRAPTEAAVRALCKAYGAPAETRRELLAIAKDLRPDSTLTRTVLQRHGSPAMQARIGRIENDSDRVRYFGPTFVIGLLQTHDYMRALLSRRYSGRELDAMVAARLARQQVLDTDRDLHLLMTEGALRWHIGSPQVMAGQAAHLAEMVGLPRLRLGIVPWTQPADCPVIHAFQIYDDRAVMVTTETATALITDPRDIADYVTRFEIYTEFASYGDAAREVFERVAGEYRNLRRDT